MKNTADAYIAILERELVPALGCTEPIAVAYAAALARRYLQGAPDEITAFCSGNIIKNVMGVNVPGAGGLKGIDTSVYMGYVCGDPEKKMQVIAGATERDVEEVRRLKRLGLCKTELLDTQESLHIVISMRNRYSSSEVAIRSAHTNVSRIVADGKILWEETASEGWDAGKTPDESQLSVSGIVEFANTVALDRVRALIEKQIACNMAIAQEGICGDWGTRVGRTILESEGDRVYRKAIAYAAAGSDARMAGCSLPVYINSGSGNQGITVSVPLIVYAREKGVPEERLHRALLVSNLLALHIKSLIGRLSAFCGAVSAGCGFGAALTYLETNADLQAIERTIVNCLGTSSGIVCDGAKTSCAAKIAVSLETAVLAHRLSLKGHAFEPHTGIIKETIEETLRAVGRVGNPGMRLTDIEILKVMAS